MRLCALLTNRRSFYSQRTGAGLKSDVSTVIEMILSAYIGHGSRHVGHDAACVADEAESASATTFTRVPHVQRHNATILAMITSTFSNSMRGFYACKYCRNLRCCEETGHKPGACSGTVATKFWTFRWEYYCQPCREYGNPCWSPRQSCSESNSRRESPCQDHLVTAYPHRGFPTFAVFPTSYLQCRRTRLGG